MLVDSLLQLACRHSVPRFACGSEADSGHFAVETVEAFALEGTVSIGLHLAAADSLVAARLTLVLGQQPGVPGLA